MYSGETKIANLVGEQLQKKKKRKKKKKKKKNKKNKKKKKRKNGRGEVGAGIRRFDYKIESFNKSHTTFC
jgi:hypothetical protein